MVKIAVGGCSFSDRRYGIVPWGDTVATLQNKTYIHEAASAGSNFRIWRRLTNHIQSGNLSKGDIIIVQYTNIDRAEAWSPHIHTVNPQEPISEPYEGGTLLRLTPHFDQHAVNKYERRLADCHVYFNNNKFNIEQFYSQHYMFASMCKQHKIQLRILNTAYDGSTRIPDIDATDILKDPDLCLDSSHPNQAGHDRIAEIVLGAL